VKRKNKQLGFINFSGFSTFLIVMGIAVGVVFGGIIFVVIPWLWNLSKPWLHTITG